MGRAIESRGEWGMCRKRAGLLMLAAMLAPLSTGCLVQPWATERMEEKYAHPNYTRTAIMPPIRDGFPPPICQDEPSEQEVLRAMPNVVRGVPFYYEEFRDEIEIVSENGWWTRSIRRDSSRWSARPNYTIATGSAPSTTPRPCRSSQPFPVKVKKRRVQVVYIDKDHLHMYAGCDPEAQKAVTRDLVGP